MQNLILIGRSLAFPCYNEVLLYYETLPMTYSQLLDKITLERGFGRDRLERYIRYFLIHVAKKTNKQERISIPNFGEFWISYTKAHALAFDTNKIVPEKRNIIFSPSDELKAFINGEKNIYEFDPKVEDDYEAIVDDVVENHFMVRKISLTINIRVFVQILIREVNRQERISIPNFGEFRISYTKAHALAFDTNKIVPEKRNIIFSPADELKSFINGDTPNYFMQKKI